MNTLDLATTAPAGVPGDRAWKAPECGSLDDTHLLAVQAAQWVVRRGGAHGDDAEAMGAQMACFYGARRGVPHAGVFLMAYTSALRAVRIEDADRRATFSVVAEQWWAGHDKRTSAGYGYPWSTTAAA
ncbi:hypothetical protein AGMMS50218_15320 [Actinomycetota bacterium]|nr:hypothetical protein AGMMS50218_15320 [Actinomycetota bacterium]